MTDNAELEAKIAALESRINHHKANDDSHATTAFGSGYSTPVYGPTHAQNWPPQRYSPYAIPRGRGYGARPPQYRNRRLIINNSGPNSNTTGDASMMATGATDTNSEPGWVTKRARHMQLINNSVYEKETAQRTKAMEATRQQKVREIQEYQKLQLQNHLRFLVSGQPHTSSSARPMADHVFVNGIKFLVADGGSKLVKASDPINMAKETPKTADVGGVTFQRSKHGNLYLSGFVKTKRAVGGKKIAQPCPQFSTTGACSKGPTCRYEHDPNKVAICRDFLQTGKCPAGVNCDLSHEPTPERVPACLHFLRGNCTNLECRYAHVRTNPAAQVCRAFATLGYCSKGASCEERHVFECPDFANKGFCRRKNCRLPHVHRAGQLRKAAAMQNTESDEGQSSDISSDDEMGAYDSDDVDSEDIEEDLSMPHALDTGLSQQENFVGF